MLRRFALGFIPFVLLAGCATQAPAPISSPTEPVPVPLPEPPPPPPPPPVAPPPALSPTPAPPPPAKPGTIKPVVDRSTRELVGRLLPDKISDRNGWRDDIATALVALKLPASHENICAAIAVIEQESSFQADPVVPGLNRIVWKKIEGYADRYGVPFPIVEAILKRKSANGRSYAERINALKTERQMNLLFEDIVDELPIGREQLIAHNPIRTGGPMQVSFAFAEQHMRHWPYPYSFKTSLRQEVFTRRGGVYFGIANLLHYPANYPEMLYRFADFNAGQYSSRNVAFQAALASVAGKRHAKLTLDGDLLIYRDGAPTTERSATLAALLAVADRLDLEESALRRDLLQEKQLSFEQTATYRRLFALADQQGGRKLPRAALPQIRLQSPKITRKLTTEWFARRVDGRYQRCLGKATALVSPGGMGG
ncbi:DUF1615 domain-containing protein [Chitinimonas lacunae]|uniref:DUF1615 domain-containing protein n=1 Tax=Chitinimonas lacunae TaxID=1963018 RepID=A0ABV8MQX2_9NEIS